MRRLGHTAPRGWCLERACGWSRGLGTVSSPSVAMAAARGSGSNGAQTPGAGKKGAADSGSSSGGGGPGPQQEPLVLRSAEEAKKASRRLERSSFRRRKKSSEERRAEKAAVQAELDELRKRGRVRSIGTARQGAGLRVALVDGYNVIMSDDDLRRLLDYASMEDARTALNGLAKAFCEAEGVRCYVVYDAMGSRDRADHLEQLGGGAAVVFSGLSEADTYIGAAALHWKGLGADEVMVVSNDRYVRDLVMDEDYVIYSVDTDTWLERTRRPAVRNASRALPSAALAWQQTARAKSLSGGGTSGDDGSGSDGSGSDEGEADGAARVLLPSRALAAALARIARTAGVEEGGEGWDEDEEEDEEDEEGEEEGWWQRRGGAGMGSGVSTHPGPGPGAEGMQGRLEGREAAGLRTDPQGAAGEVAARASAGGAFSGGLAASSPSAGLGAGDSRPSAEVDAAGDGGASQGGESSGSGGSEASRKGDAGKGPGGAGPGRPGGSLGLLGKRGRAQLAGLMRGAADAASRADGGRRER